MCSTCVRRSPKKTSPSLPQGALPAAAPCSRSSTPGLPRSTPAIPPIWPTPSRATARDAALDTLLYQWVGAGGVAPTTRGGAMDARKVVALENLFGDPLGNPDSNSAIQLERSYRDMREYYNASLLAQTELKDLYDVIQYRWDDASQTLKGGVNQGSSSICVSSSSSVHLGVWPRRKSALPCRSVSSSRWSEVPQPRRFSLRPATDSFDHRVGEAALAESNHVITKPTKTRQLVVSLRF